LPFSPLIETANLSPADSRAGCNFVLIFLANVGLQDFVRHGIWLTVAGDPRQSCSVPARQPRIDERRSSRDTFLEAEGLNGLHRATLKPFRLKVSFKLADPSGTTAEQGTIDELWGSPHLRKVVISMGSSSLIYPEVGKETLREGELNQKFALLSLLEKSFVDPVPYTKESLPDLELSYETVRLGSTTLPCFRLKVTRGVSHTFNDPTYCLESQQILRVGSFADDPPCSES